MNPKPPMMFQIAPSSGMPIYRQIMEQIHRMVASGRLKAGDSLPSVRQVAKHLAVNPMTLSKAYSLLEAEGVLDRQRGKGMVIAEDKSQTLTVPQRLDLMRTSLDEAARQAKQLKLPREAVLSLFDRILEGRS